MIDLYLIRYHYASPAAMNGGTIVAWSAITFSGRSAAEKKKYLPIHSNIFLEKKLEDN